MRQFERPTLAHALPAKLYRRAKEFWRARQAIADANYAKAQTERVMAERVRAAEDAQLRRLPAAPADLPAAPVAPATPPGAR